MDSGEAMGWGIAILAIIAAGVVLVLATITAGNSLGVRWAENSVKKQQAQAAAEYYRLCKRQLKTGVITDRCRP